jgi:DMSO reductase family type II enzyme chaperone
MIGTETMQGPARSKMYQLLATAFFYPDDELHALVHDDTFVKALKECAEILADGSGSALLEKLEAEGGELSGVSSEELERQYGETFGHSLSRDCPPCETEFDAMHIFQQTHDLADIAGYYRAFGLEVAEKQGERLDHIGAELEFMGFLAYKEHYARENHGEDKALICEDTQRKFLKEHLGRWAPLFFKLLREKAPRGFYRGIAAITAEFVAMEIGLLGVSPDFIDNFEASAMSVDDFDDTCGPCVEKSENPSSHL